MSGRVDTEDGFDFANIQASGDAAAFATLGRFTGVVSDPLNLDLSPYVGQDLLVQFLMTSDQLIPGTGWWVDQVSVTSNDFALQATLPANPTSITQSVPLPGTYRFRIAGLYPVDLNELLGPYTNSTCVCVPTSAGFNDPFPSPAIFGNGFEDGEPAALPQVTCQ